MCAVFEWGLTVLSNAKQKNDNEFGFEPYANLSNFHTLIQGLVLCFPDH